MTMQTQDIRQLAAWLALTDIDFLELLGPDVQVRIYRNGSASAVAGSVEPDPPVAISPEANAAVRAPSVGVLLDRIPGRSAPLWSPGADVQAGSLIGLLQVGPLLLPVRAPCDGRLDKWLAPPGTAVGYGAHLLNVETVGTGPR
jgi:acetyl-CoA carboxylase biotin carboxyl carrier protein